MILIAGGIGITPVSAMARRAQALGMAYTLHYCGRTRAGMALLDDHRDVVLTRSEREANRRMMSCCSRACGGQKLVLEL